MLSDDFLSTPTPLDHEGPPEIVEMELMHTCNLRCIMCHVAYEQLTKRKLELRFLDQLNGLTGKWAKIGAQYEPVAHPQFAEIANGVSERGMRIDLTTNGTLFTERMVRRIEKANFQIVTVSFDGSTAATYERVRQRGHFSQAIEGILAFRQAVLAQNPNAQFCVNYTFMMSNIAEVVDATELWDRLGFDHIGFISMTIPGEDGAARALARESPNVDLSLVRSYMAATARRIVDSNLRITASSPWFRSPEILALLPPGLPPGIAASVNPNRRFPVNPIPYFQDGNFPGVPVRCRSPYKLVRINYDGKVRLCNAHTVGSIYDAPLLDIWKGRRAVTLRANIDRDHRICGTCDYYRFCIKASEVDYSDQVVFAKQPRRLFYDPTYPRFAPSEFALRFIYTRPALHRLAKRARALIRSN